MLAFSDLPFFPAYLFFILIYLKFHHQSFSSGAPAELASIATKALIINMTVKNESDAHLRQKVVATYQSKSSTATSIHRWSVPTSREIELAYPTRPKEKKPSHSNTATLVQDQRKLERQT